MAPRSGTTITTHRYIYLVTITKQQKLDHVTKEQIDQIILKIKYKFDDTHLMDYSYETSGMYNQLHCHLILDCPSGLRYGLMTSHNGFRIHWKKVRYGEVANVQSYINKDQLYQTQDQILDINYFKLYRFT